MMDGSLHCWCRWSGGCSNRSDEVEYLKLREKCNHPPRGKLANAIHEPTWASLQVHQIYMARALSRLDAQRNERLETFCSAKLSDNRTYVALVAVNLEVHPAHVLDRNFSAQLCQAGTQPRDSFKRIATHYRYRIVRREIPQVVFQRNEMQRFDQPVRGISCHHIDFLLHQRAIQQPEIQLAGCLSEFQPVA